MTPKVECYAGASYPEKPRAFDWEGQHFIVDEILNQYREPGGIGFLVRCTPGQSLFSLLFRIREDDWQIQPKSSVMISDEPRQN
jgi:hypothetical protein